MSYRPNFPPTLISKLVNDNALPNNVSRDEIRKMKDVEEARKAGTIPAMKDEQGCDINPHMPQYIMQAPWYYYAVTPTLKHQRLSSDAEARKGVGIEVWHKKGEIESAKPLGQWKPGCCENCGASTHKRKDCLDRPRKANSKMTKKVFTNDEYLTTELPMSFDGKRDRWNGYDPTSYAHVVEKFQKIEEAKRDVRAKKLETEGVKSDNEDEKDIESMDMPGQKCAKDSKTVITVRNLRIREDTAKYLYDLDTNAAFYDPKSRAMRTSIKKGNSDEIGYMGENYLRASGDAADFLKQQLFSWETAHLGSNLNFQADPTTIEYLSKEVRSYKENANNAKRQAIMDIYGGQEHLERPPDELLMAQTEEYHEYSKYGQIIKGTERIPMSSKYVEDEFVNNHKSVFGSFWSNGKWGYKCCRSLIKNSYCIGLQTSNDDF